MPPIQLSHDELLLLLGILRLPLPLALGEDPTAGYDERTLNAALSSALSGLLARGYLEEPSSDATPPQVDPTVEELVTDSALAEGCLMVATQRGATNETVHYSLRGDRALAHTSPRERVHRLERLAGSEVIVERIIAAITPPPRQGAPRTFIAAADAVGAATEAAGRPDDARRALARSGVAQNDVAAFIEQLGAGSTRHALVALREPRGATSAVESVIVVQGPDETWCLETMADRPGDVCARALDAIGLEATVHALLGRMSVPAAIVPQGAV